MIVHAKVLLDQFAHAGARPQIGLVTGFQRTPPQQPDQFVPLLLRQPRRFTRMRLGGQAIHPLLLDRDLPAFYGGPRCSDELRDFGNSPPLKQQPPRDPSLGFQL